MKRRRVLALLSAALPLAGCFAPEAEVQPDQSDNSTPTVTEATDTPDSSEDIFVSLQNETTEPVTAAVTITTNNSVFLEEEVSAGPSGINQLYSGITEQGDYELVVSIDDQREAEFSFGIGEYDLRMGSNLIVWIRDDEVGIGIEQ
ncbi:hypothetical protein [Halomicrobium salinisoli]|uniref:hypothetical protein n=1 Tax=Halomicrobium salinisoli TaxID=2878391 RepID=UPI001CF0BA72|nr:hypothetical protein [Halomicrobium salinisoli]